MRNIKLRLKKTTNKQDMGLRANIEALKIVGRALKGKNKESERRR